MVVAPEAVFRNGQERRGFSLLGKTENNEGHSWLIHKSSVHLCLQRGTPAGEAGSPCGRGRGGGTMKRFPGLEFFGYGVAETGFRMLQFG